MAPNLGKRKRVTREELGLVSRSPSPSSASASDKEDLQAAFRRAFEAKFTPLAVEPKRPAIEEPRAEEHADRVQAEDESDWSGISDENDGVEVIDLTHSLRTPDQETSKAELKAFMSSKPPTSTSAPSKSLTAKKKADDDDKGEATNLKNDLALQKLLRESHLLSSSKSSSGTSTPLSTTGLARHKSADLHLQSLGAKASVFAQKKMPMAQRKHMMQKARTTEEKRRTEAKEAGIILERPTMGKSSVKRDFGSRKREQAVGTPSVGKFRGGTLSLSKKDVRSITGGGGGSKRKEKGSMRKR